jgi:hypothetical protein
MEGGWNSKLTFCFMETTHEPLHLDKRSLVQWKIMDIPTDFVWIIIFLDISFEYGYGGIFKLLRFMRNLYQSMWDHETLYADRSSKDKQLLIIPFFRNTKNMNMAGSWIFKYIFYFMEKPHEPLHLHIWSIIHWKSWPYLQGLFESLFSLTELLNVVVVKYFEVMLGQMMNCFV